MAFVVEDGTGLPNATSLVDVAFADDYFGTLGNEAWTALTTDQKEVRLNRGTQAACSYYTYKGSRLTTTQALCFPRTGVSDPSGVPVTGVPNCVKQVVCEFGVRAITPTALFPDPSFDQNGRAVKRIKQQAGPLQQEIEYAGPGDLVIESRFPSIDALMCSWLIIPQETGTNGVVIAPAGVSGVSLSQMAAVASNPDRYSGPFDENGKDTFAVDSERAKRGPQP